MKKITVILLFSILSFAINSSVTATTDLIESSEDTVSTKSIEETQISSDNLSEQRQPTSETSFEEHPETTSTSISESSIPQTTDSDETNYEKTLRSTVPQTPLVGISSHVRSIGWQQEISNGNISGTTGAGLRLEGLKIRLINSPYIGDIEYRAHVQRIGWQTPAAKNGALAGTTGQGLQLEAITVNLTGEIADYYDIYYQLHVKKLGWLDWAKNGEMAGSSGYGYQAEAVRICLVRKDGAAPGNIEKSYQIAPPNIVTTAHISKQGWQKPAESGQIIGTTGKSLPIEALKIQLTNNTPYQGTLTYATHVAKLGWLPEVNEGELGGTTSQSRAMQAITISLSGEISNYFDIYYQAHIQKKGWLNWAKNGEFAGSVGLGLNLEALRIVIIEKGATPQDYRPTEMSILGLIDTSTTEGRFIHSISSSAQQIANEKGLFPSVMLAQAILESSYGKSKLAVEANNYFGIKFVIGKDEGLYEKYLVVSDEEINGIKVPVNSYFRKYSTFSDSLKDNANKLANGTSWDAKYYSGAWRINAKSYREATQALQGRYATDSAYATKLNTIIEKWKLYQFD